MPNKVYIHSSVLAFLLILASCIPLKEEKKVKQVIVRDKTNSTVITDDKALPYFANFTFEQNIELYQPLATNKVSLVKLSDYILKKTHDIYYSNINTQIIPSTIIGYGQTDYENYAFNSLIYDDCYQDVIKTLISCGNVDLYLKESIKSDEFPRSIHIHRSFTKYQSYFAALYYTLDLNSYKSYSIDNLKSYRYNNTVQNGYIFKSNRSLANIDKIFESLERGYKMTYSGFGSMIIKNIADISTRERNIYQVTVDQFSLPISLEVTVNPDDKFPDISASINYFSSFDKPSDRPEINLEDFNLNFSGLTRIKVNSENLNETKTLARSEVNEYYKIDSITVSSKTDQKASNVDSNSGQLNFFGFDTLEEVAGSLRFNIRGSIENRVFPYSLGLLSFIGFKPQ